MHTWKFFVLSLIGVSLAACAPDAKQNGGTITDRYIVVFKKDHSAAKSAPVSTAAKLNIDGPVKVFSHALNAGVYHMSEEQASAMAADDSVAYVEKDQEVHINNSQSAVTWGLDRLDQASLPLDSTYNYPAPQAQVNAYIIDTGINLTHVEFEGRASSGADLVDNDTDATDCNGHGTHVAGTIGSKTYGVAKSAKLIAVRVLDCNGSGSISGVVAGIEWVTQHHVGPSVANMSLGGGVSQALDDAMNASIASGVTYVVAAGNDNADACSGSPSRVANAITVGASTSADARASFSNFGSCVDIFAPGLDITSTWLGSNTATNTISGTSMASPHVAGVAALYLSLHPSASPAEVSAALVGGARPGKISNPGSGSPNLLLNIAFLGGGSGGGSGSGNPDASQLQNGVAVEGLSAAKDAEKQFTIDVPAGSSNLVVEISGGSGDADLYVRAAGKPSVSQYDCRPYKSGNDESCAVRTPVAGRYYVMVKAYAAFSGLRIKASYKHTQGH